MTFLTGWPWPGDGADDGVVVGGDEMESRMAAGELMSLARLRTSRCRTSEEGVEVARAAASIAFWFRLRRRRRVRRSFFR